MVKSSFVKNINVRLGLYADNIKRQVFSIPCLVAALAGYYFFSDQIFMTQMQVFAWAGIIALFLSIGLRLFATVWRLKKGAREEDFGVCIPENIKQTYVGLYASISFTTALGWAFISFGTFSVHDVISAPSVYSFLVTLGIATMAIHNMSAHIPVYGLFVFTLFAPSFYFFAKGGHWSFFTMIAFYNFYLVVQAILFRRTQVLSQVNLNRNIEQRAYYKSVIDSVPGLVAIIDEKLNYGLVNKGLCEFIGSDEDKMLGRAVGFMNDSLFSKEIAEFQKSADRSKQFHCQFKNKAGEVRWFFVAAHKLNADKEIIVVSIDVHDRIAAEQENIKQKELMEASSRMATLGQVAAGIAHEINNPLSIIVGKTNLLKRRWNTMEKKDIESELDRIEQTSFRISKIIKSLKSLSRDGEKDPYLKIEVATLVTDVMNLFGEKIKHQSVNLENRIPPGLILQCQNIQIGQVIANLVANSMDAIKDLDEKWIRLDAREVADKIEIKVTDSGPGIPPEIADKLMTPFFTTKPPGLGTGLGLSISRRIIADHDGEFILDRANPNTCFILLLPKYIQNRKAA